MNTYMAYNNPSRRQQILSYLIAILSSIIHSDLFCLVSSEDDLDVYELHWY